jgi:luciferase family oxidoreductase group 1
MPPEHPFAHLVRTLPGRPERPEPWLLGSSRQSAIWAAELGLPYAFADFINPEGAEIAALYRERFAAHEHAINAEPRIAVAVWVICADTDEQAEHIAASGRMAFTLLRRGQLIAVPPPEKAERFLATDRAGEQPRRSRRRTVVGSPERVAAQLSEVVVEYGAQEAIAVNITYDHQARRRSYELLAQALRLGERVGVAR